MYGKRRVWNLDKRKPWKRRGPSEVFCGSLMQKCLRNFAVCCFPVGTTKMDFFSRETHKNLQFLVDSYLGRFFYFRALKIVFELCAFNTI